MNNLLTDITIVVDRSGSMHGCKTDAEGGLNNFIKEQSEQPGIALLTLVEFDHEYNFVHRGQEVGKVPTYQLVPRGMTAMYDAVGCAIVETGKRLAAIPEQDRPGLVIFVIITDGQENASREYTGLEVRKMIEEQQTKYNWKFTFLGAGIDAFKTAANIGIAAINTMSNSPNLYLNTYSALSASTTRARAMASAGASIDIQYTEAERDASA